LSMAMMEDSRRDDSVSLAQQLEMALAEDYSFQDTLGCYVQVTNPQLENLLRGQKQPALMSKDDSKTWSSNASTSASSSG